MTMNLSRRDILRLAPPAGLGMVLETSLLGEERQASDVNDATSESRHG